MENISKYLHNARETQKGRVTSEWADQIRTVISFMGETNERFPYWCGNLRRFRKNPSALYQLMQEAKNGKNPRALFRWLLTEHLKNAPKTPRKPKAKNKRLPFGV